MTSHNRLGMVADRDFLLHQIPGNVRESPKRLWSLYQRIEDPVIAALATRYKAREATESEITTVHSDLYLSQLREHAVSLNPFSYDKDTYLMEDTLYVAALAAGGCLVLGDAVMDGAIDAGLALIRPPGHHAGIGNGAGFCVFNHIALLARHLQCRYHLDRILILDLDAHHGNGTQEIFWNDPGVLFVSVHQENLFPLGSGSAAEAGDGEGAGYTINVPVKPGFGDLEYSYIMGTVVHELIDKFAPEIILVSMGFDAHVDDPISELAVTTEGYHQLAKIIEWYARMSGARGPVYILEGGYIASSLEASVLALLKGMAAPAEPQSMPFSPRANTLLKRSILPELSPLWSLQHIP